LTVESESESEMLAFPLLLKRDTKNTADALTWSVGHFLLTHLLLERLRASPGGGGRVVNVVANVYRLGEIVLDDLQFEQQDYHAGAAYAQSKLALLLFTRKLSQQLQGICVYFVGCKSVMAMREVLYDKSRARNSR